MRDWPDSNEQLKSVDLSELIQTVTSSKYEGDEAFKEAVTGEPANAIPQASVEAVEQKYAQQLAATGLALENEEGKTDGVLHLTLSDPEQFTKYLHAIAGGATPSQIEGVRGLTYSFELDLFWREKFNSQALELLVALLSAQNDLETAYNALDPNNNHKILEKFEEIRLLLEAVKGKYIHEFFLAHKNGLSVNFLPFRLPWHTDSNEAHYDKRWELNVSVVKEIGKNPAALQFQKALIHKLLGDILDAEIDIPERYPEEDKKERVSWYLGTLRKAREALLKISREQGI